LHGKLILSEEKHLSTKVKFKEVANRLSMKKLVKKP
jgi:hypothetical protein